MAEHDDGDILCVGLLCMDMLNYVADYPTEDSDNRMLEHRWSLGGNAANNVTVLTQLGANVRLVAPIPARGILGGLVQELCVKANIDTRLCVRRDDEALPISTAIVNTSNGTRTIMHQPNGFVELSFDEVIECIGDARQDQWIHFEGRNFDVTRRVLETLRTLKNENDAVRPIISVEAEKIRPSPLVEQLIPLADIVFISKDFARKHGCENMLDAVRFVKKTFARADATVICGWGDKGACAISPNDETTSVPVHVPGGPIIDTLGAGDSFIAACIRAMSRGCSMATTLRLAVTVAGEKCAQRGLVDLKLPDVDVV